MSLLAFRDDQIDRLVAECDQLRDPEVRLWATLLRRALRKDDVGAVARALQGVARAVVTHAESAYGLRRRGA